MTRTEAKVAKRGRERQEDIPTLLQYLKDGSLDLERSIAAYEKLSGALQTVEGRAPENREQGLPLFMMKASADGVHVLDVALDLREVNPEYLRHVLLPLCQTQHRRMLKHATLLYNVIAQMYKQIKAVSAEEEEPEVSDEDNAALPAAA